MTVAGGIGALLHASAVMEPSDLLIFGQSRRQMFDQYHEKETGRLWSNAVQSPWQRHQLLGKYVPRLFTDDGSLVLHSAFCLSTRPTLFSPVGGFITMPPTHPPSLRFASRAQYALHSM